MGCCSRPLPPAKPFCPSGPFASNTSTAAMLFLSFHAMPNHFAISITVANSAVDPIPRLPRSSRQLLLNQSVFSINASSLNPINSSLFRVSLRSPRSKCYSRYLYHDDGGRGNDIGGGGNNSFNSGSWWRWWPDDGRGSSDDNCLLFPLARLLANRSDETTYFLSAKPFLFFLAIYLFVHFGIISPANAESDIHPARDDGKDGGGERKDAVYEVKGGKRIELIPDYSRDVFMVPQWCSWSWSSLLASGVLFPYLWKQCKDLCLGLMLPAGFPDSVTSDYLEYSLWRGVQGVAAQVSGVLATQSLLYAVGLGKGAIPTAAALNWVLKDGIGYLGKILLSKYGRHFDVHPKGWRLFADLLENAAHGMEILTPAFPHLFVPIGAAAGAGRSAAALIQASTRSCFFAGFAAQRNFAEVIAKGEAQGMVSKSIGIALGIALANCIRSSTPLALASFGVVTWVHMFCNLKSYQSIQLRTLNPYRASLVFSEYLLSGLVPSVKEVNDEEPLFPTVSVFNIKPKFKVQTEELSSDAKVAAANIACRLRLGSKLSDVVKCKDDAAALFDLYKHEGYILAEHDGKFCVILKDSCVPKDMLKSLFHVSYLYWLEENAGIKSWGISNECKPGGRLEISLDYVQREFNHIKNDADLVGWVTDGLIARPLPNRVRPGHVASA